MFNPKPGEIYQTAGYCVYLVIRTPDGLKPIWLANTEKDTFTQAFFDLKEENESRSHLIGYIDGTAMKNLLLEKYKDE